MMNIFKNKKFKYILFLIFVIYLFFFPFKNENNTNIAVLNIDGVILESDKIVKALDSFNKDDYVKAIILRIDSPGGSVAPSQEIYHKVNEIKLSKKKPIIASVNNMAASGGYYIAIGADMIVVNSGSIVGSIGVIMSHPIAKKLLDNLGVDFKTYKSGEFKDSGSPYRYSSKNDSIYFNQVVADLHSQFINEVSMQRNIELNILNKFAQGQVFTGRMADSIGLIDTIGTFEDALNISKNLANISGDIDIVYPEYERYSFLNNFINFYNINFRNYLMPMYIMN